MKLELKHLAPFFPYGLTGKTKSEIDPWKIIGFKEDSFSITEPTLLCTHPTYKNVINIWSRNIKPILRPLSDLTEIFYWDNLQDGDCELDSERINEIKNTPRGHLKFYQTNYLFKHHFDVFGLIEKGLAIDINTLSVQNDG